MLIKEIEREKKIAKKESAEVRVEKLRVPDFLVLSSSLIVPEFFLQFFLKPRVWEKTVLLSREWKREFHSKTNFILWSRSAYLLFKAIFKISAVKYEELKSSKRV